MSRYIDADFFNNIDYSEIYDGQLTEDAIQGMETILNLIDRQETVEKPTITGHWINKGMDKYELAYGCYAYMPKCECSVCGHIQETYIRGDKPNEDELDYPPFCEMCGSKNAERIYPRF